MPGQPLLRAFSERIEREGIEDKIFERIAEGAESMRVIAASLGVSRGMLYSWIKAGGEERRMKFEVAREISAHGLAEDGLDILDNTIAATTQDVQIATQRANYRRWLAGVRNREDYGERAQSPLINVNLGSLHVDALRHGQRQGNATPLVEGADVDVVPLITEGSEE
jgi:AcrR family transcriptional regulator